MLVNYCNGEVRGVIEEDYKQLIDEWFEGRSEAVLLKDKPARTIWSVQNKVIIKKIRIRGLMQKCKRLFNFHPARWEFEQLTKLRDKGINVPIPFAYLEDSNSFYLVTQKLQDAVPLDTYLKKFDGDKDIFIEKLADFIKMIIETGFVSTDMHAGNILVTGDTQDPQFFLADVYEGRLSPGHSSSYTIRMLSFFIHSIYLKFKVSHIIKFIKKCLPAQTDTGNLLRLILSDFKRVYHRHRAARTSRCLYTNSSFLVLSKNGCKYFLSRQISIEEVQDVIDSSKKCILLKQLPDRRIYHNGRYLIKEVINRGSIIKGWIASHGLTVRGITTPCCFAAVMTSSKGYLIFEYLKDALPLYEFIKQNFPLFNAEQRSKFTRNLAKFVKHMHENEVFHKDLKANNILVSKTGDEIKFYLVDVEQVRFKKNVGIGMRIKNLAQLNAAIGRPVSITDRLRFYDFYAGVNLKLCKYRKKLIEKIMKITRRRKHIWPEA